MIASLSSVHELKTWFFYSILFHRSMYCIHLTKSSFCRLKVALASRLVVVLTFPAWEFRRWFFIGLKFFGWYIFEFTCQYIGYCGRGHGKAAMRFHAMASYATPRHTCWHDTTELYSTVHWWKTWSTSTPYTSRVPSLTVGVKLASSVELADFTVSYRVVTVT
jgi:hypothetical protein